MPLPGTSPIQIPKLPSRGSTPIRIGTPSRVTPGKLNFTDDLRGWVRVYKFEGKFQRAIVFRNVDS